MIKLLLHASLLVSDLAAARFFYEGILELEASPKRPVMSFDGVWYEIGAQQIHLIALPDPAKGISRPAHGGRDQHLAFAVENIEELKRKLEQVGILYSVSSSGRRALFCRDPDGNALEFVEAE